MGWGRGSGGASQGRVGGNQIEEMEVTFRKAKQCPPARVERGSTFPAHTCGGVGEEPTKRTGIGK